MSRGMESHAFLRVWLGAVLGPLWDSKIVLWLVQLVKKAATKQNKIDPEEGTQKA